jgi:hypothetical protein
MSTINVNSISPESGTDLTIGDSGDTVSISATTVGVRSSGTSTPTYDYNTLGEGLWLRYWDNSPIRTADIVAIGNTPAGATQAMRFLTNTGGSPGTAVERMSIDPSGNLKFNSGYGSTVTAFGVRAWVNFDGTGTLSVKASGNVSSVTDNTTGDYTVNLTTAMPDIDYAISVNVRYDDTGYGGWGTVGWVNTASAFRIRTGAYPGSNIYDMQDVWAMVVR